MAVSKKHCLIHIYMSTFRTIPHPVDHQYNLYMTPIADPDMEGVLTP